MFKRVLVNLTDQVSFSRNSFSHFKNVEFKFNADKPMIMDPDIFLGEDTITIAQRGTAPNGSISEKHIPAAPNYPFVSVATGFSSGLMDWVPEHKDEEGNLVDYFTDEDTEVWVICNYVSIPNNNRPVKFSLLPLDDGYMVFCLKEGTVRITKEVNGNYDEHVVSRGDQPGIADGTLYSTFSSENLPFAPDDSPALEVLRNSFISGTVTNRIQSRKIRGSQHAKSFDSQSIHFTPKIEFSARLDQGTAYEAEQVRLRKLEEERIAQAERDAIMRAEAEEARARKEAEEASKPDKKKSSSSKSKSSKTTKAAKASAILADLGLTL